MMIPAYDHMTRLGYRNLRIEHGARVYARGNIHTNSIEGFWPLVRRGISGVYHAVSPKYPQSYLDGYTSRYNYRKDGQAMFKAVLSQLKFSSD
ncbi:MAG: transposase [Dehalococcoidales bacterium]|nr:transposase [Dehalococcoidales bacterium]